MTVIAIDGPSASGNSTVARGVAARLGYPYMDSGALYRGITWKVIESGIDSFDGARVVEMAAATEVAFSAENGALVFDLDGRRLTDELREQVVNDNVSIIAAIPGVRKLIVDLLRSSVAYGNIVMEGRDIGTAVFPDAAAKFYLDASPEERARRRHLEMSETGQKIEMARVRDSLVSRDDMDRARAKDPLRRAEDAVVLDSTAMSIDDVVNRILAELESAGI